jgi:5-methylcytosine-specific restriction protein A
MAAGIKKPCGFHGCRNTSLGRYCPDHTKQVSQQYDRERASDPVRKLYHKAQWYQVRLVVLARDPICVECKHAATEEIDHVIPARAYSGDFYDPDNLQGLCRSCHSSKTAVEGGFAGNNRI